MRGKMLKEKTSKQRGSMWGSSRQREQPKKTQRKRNWLCVGELLVLKRSQTLQPSPQPRLHQLQRLPLPGPAPGPAINTFSITTTGEQKGRGGEEGGWRRTLEESERNLLDDTSGHKAQMCYSGGPPSFGPGTRVQPNHWLALSSQPVI